MGDFAHEVHELYLGDVEGFDFDVAGDLGLHGLEFDLGLLADGEAGLLLAGELFEFFFEVHEEAAGVGVGGDEALGFFVLGDGGVLGHEFAEGFGLVEDLLGVCGHGGSFERLGGVFTVRKDTRGGSVSVGRRGGYRVGL